MTVLAATPVPKTWSPICSEPEATALTVSTVPAMLPVAEKAGVGTFGAVVEETGLDCGSRSHDATPPGWSQISLFQQRSTTAAPTALDCDSDDDGAE